MTEPAPVIRVAPDWQPWQLARSEPWIAPEVLDPSVNWPAETLVGVVVTVYSILLGAAVGLLWPREAPHIRLVSAIGGSEAATKALLGDDLWLALLGGAAGVLSVALLALVGRDRGGGPGGVIGLAIGGVVGSLVAARVGYLVQQPHLALALSSAFPGITHHSTTTILGYFDFRLRAKSALMAWPIAALVMQSGVMGLRFLLSGRRRRRYLADPWRGR